MTQAIEQAREERTALQEHYERNLQAKLESIADGCAGKLDELAQKTAMMQKEVTIVLGKDGVQRLRTALRAAAHDLSADLVVAKSAIQWPTGQYINSSDFHSAIFKYLYGERLSPFVRIMKSSGYDVGDSWVLPQSLYDIESFDVQAQLQRLLAAKTSKINQLEKAHAESLIADLWADTSPD